MLRRLLQTLISWTRSLLRELGAYFAFTVAGTIVVTAIYYWLLLTVTNAAWSQISLTVAAVAVGVIVALYVHARIRSNMTPDERRHVAIQAGVLCGWEALATLFLFTSNFAKLLPQYDDISAVSDVTLIGLFLAYLVTMTASAMAIRITAHFFIRQQP